LTLATAFLSQTTLSFVLLGLATGALTGLVALGIVLVYRASGILNFAAGALGGLGAFICYSLRDDFGVPAWASIVVGLLAGAVLGAMTFGVMALIGRASLLTKLIATLALLSAAEGVMTVIWGTNVTQPASFLPTATITFGGIRIGEDRLILIGLALALAVVLRLVYSKTRFGLATSAVAENRRVVASAGWSARRIELINFTVAGVLAALAAILLAPIITLTASVLSVTVVAALAAALVGRFSSFGITVVAALVIGILQNELSLFQPDLANTFKVSEPSLTGLPEVVPLVIILALAIISGRGRLARGESLVRLPLPGSGQVSIVPLVVGVGIAATLLAAVSSWADALTTTFGIGIIICSVVVVSGYAGQLSLCQFALGGFGAWVASKMVVVYHLPFLLAILIAIIVTIAAGLVVALPALRTRGVNLAVATLALALLFNAILFTNPSLTGGFVGTVVPAPKVFLFNVNPIDYPQRYGVVVLVALVLAGLVVANVRRGRTGRRMLAVRSNERAAAALGISVTGVKLYAFGLGAGVAALGGILLAFQEQNIQFQTFDVFGSILLVQLAVLGGLGWVAGIAVGAIAVSGGLASQVVSSMFPNLNNVGEWLAIVSGLAVIQLIRQAPDGLAAMISGSPIARHFARFRIPREIPLGTDPIVYQRRPPVTLAVESVTVRFGGVVAVDAVSFRVAPGEVVGLIGPNGAGKTTLLDVITGFTQPQEGAVRLDGVDVGGWTPERRARLGIARSWQAVELFDEMTVLENLLVGSDRQQRSHYLTDLLRPGRQKVSAMTQTVIEDFDLSRALEKRPSSLPQGHARLVGIARAIVGDPTILMLDEPAAGLGPDESTELATAIQMIVNRLGIGVLIVEHDVPFLLSICDRIVALDFGQKIAEGTPAEVSADEGVIRAYLGEANESVPQQSRVHERESLRAPN
jgi:ABC-type branched-subunit amino acid transport system ATPase component/ABC-type branched-subunit amino acid transport system permease subunit